VNRINYVKVDNGRLRAYTTIKISRHGSVWDADRSMYAKGYIRLARLGRGARRRICEIMRASRIKVKARRAEQPNG